MKTTCLSVLTMALVFTGCDKGAQPTAPDPGAPMASGTNAGSTKAAPDAAKSGNPVTAPVDYLGAIGAAKKSMEKNLDLVTLKKAIEAFQAEEGRNPRDLNELVASKQLQALPKPPFGMKIVYDAAKGEASIVKE